jgi:hypothetical protein
MRRVGLTVLVAGMAVAGCGSFRDIFTSHAETAARVGNRELKSERVADVIARIGGANANPLAAEFVTGIWVDMGLFADKVASGNLKTDSLSLLRLMWPQLAEQRVTAWHDSIVARRSEVSQATADSVYNAGEIRVLQHILFAPGGTTAADTANAKAQAEKVLPQAKKGDFGKLAAQYSADGSKADNGYLPAFPKGKLVPEFESAGWALQPGEVSGLVKTQFGYHIIRRPPVSEIRDRLITGLKQRQTALADSAYMAELTARNTLELKPGASAALRTAVSDLPAARKSKKEIVAMKSGGFTVSDAVRWLEAMPPQQLGQVKQAPDSLLGQFAKTLALNTLLLKEADSAKIEVSPAIFQALALQYKSQIANLKEAMGLDSTEFSDSTKVSVPERRKDAGLKVDAYFERLTKGQAQFRPMPTTLSAELRAEGDYKIFQAGVTRAMELIVQRKKQDSTGQGPVVGPGPLQQAPGGPPQPGRPADTTKKP